MSYNDEQFEAMIAETLYVVSNAKEAKPTKAKTTKKDKAEETKEEA